jgi:hypothetical protein
MNIVNERMLEHGEDLEKRGRGSGRERGRVCPRRISATITH